MTRPIADDEATPFERLQTATHTNDEVVETLQRCQGGGHHLAAEGQRATVIAVRRRESYVPLAPSVVSCRSGANSGTQTDVAPRARHDGEALVARLRMGAPDDAGDTGRSAFLDGISADAAATDADDRQRGPIGQSSLRAPGISRAADVDHADIDGREPRLVALPRHASKHGWLRAALAQCGRPSSDLELKRAEPGAGLAGGPDDGPDGRRRNVRGVADEDGTAAILDRHAAAISIDETGT